MDASLLQRIDFMRLAQNLGGDKQRINETLNQFMKTTTITIDKLAEAEKAQNIILWQQINQQLKRSAQHITAKRMVTLCLEADEIKEFAHPQSQQIVYNIYKEMALLREAIIKHLNSRPEPLL